MGMDKVLTSGEFAKITLEQYDQGLVNQKSYQEHVQYEEGKKFNEDMITLQEGLNNVRTRQQKLSSFSEQLKENLLQECLCSIFDEVMKAERATQHEMAIGHSMISKLIKEEGVNNLLTRFEYKNIILSEFARCTEKYHALVMETVGQKASAEPDDDSCYVFDKEIAMKFMDDVKDITPQRTIDLIRDRVGDAMQTFVDQNTENKLAIKDIYTKAKVSTEKAESDTVKEEYAARARYLTEQVYSKPTNVFGAMVNIIGESVVQNKDLQQHYMEGTTLKMNALADDVRVMYTVLEMANTINAISVNENYIKQII